MVMEGEIKPGINEKFEWNVENEIYLFEAMVGCKPVGIHKHFHMACICEKFETLLGKPISPNTIWDHLKDMYDLAALDKKETVHFPNEVEEFTLPVSDFSDLIANKMSKTEICSEGIRKDDKYTSKSIKEHSHGIETGKKERKLEHEGSNVEIVKIKIEGKDYCEVKRGRMKKEDKVPGRRGKRSLKDKKLEENLQVSTPNIKKGDEGSTNIQTVKKRGRRMFAKRILRSRMMDEATSKSSSTSTPPPPPPPPPAKRGRRIHIT